MDQTQVLDDDFVLSSATAAILLWKRSKGRYVTCFMQADHPQVQLGGECLPTFSEFKAVTLENKSRTVQDVWGLVLTSLPGKQMPFDMRQLCCLALVCHPRHVA